jgi:hypothetical protein
VVERVELQQLVASEVLKLAEPYRSTVLLRFIEELSCADIARRHGIPEGTVRRRLKVALDDLRERLGTKPRTNGGALAALGVLTMKKSVIAAIALLLLILAGVWWWKKGGSGAGEQVHTAGAQHAGSSAAAAARGGSGSGASADGDAAPAWLAQAGVAPRRIAGRVVFRGAPVAGATVELASLASESGLTPAPQRTTNASGEFDFGSQRAMPWSVRASAPGKAGGRVDIDLRNPRANPAPDHLELELGACTAAMIGTVRDASGGPIAKAKVAGQAAAGQAVTDEKGHYELCIEPRWPGWVTGEVSADGYAAISFSTVVPGRIEIDFALVPEAVIVGRVVREDTGAAIANAYVFVPEGPRGRRESTPLRATFTDPSGHFRLDRMTPGRHLVFARAEGMAQAAQGTQVTVGVGQTSIEIEIRLEEGSTIRGTVVDDGKPIAGARVTAYDVVHGGPDAVSQDDGSFELAGVPRGDTRFTARPYDVVSPKTFHVDRSLHEGVTIEVDSLGTIIGHVVRGKQPVAAANIDIHGPDDRDLGAVSSDATGRFEVHGLQPGPWMVYASDDRAGAFGRAPETVQLARGQTAEITIDLAYAASIAGRVVDQTGAPVPGVTVVFRSLSSDDSGITATAMDGTFRAATMTGGGEYRPIVRRALLASSPLQPVGGGEFPTIELADGSSAITGVVLAVQIDRLAIAGRVVDSDGAPVADARVTAWALGSPDSPMFVRAFQDPADTTTVDGQFSIGGLQAGAYILHARSPSGVEATLSDVRAGRTDVTLMTPRPGAIEVTVVGFKSTPQVTAELTGGSSAPVVGVAQPGGFALRNLSPGRYLVTARTTAEAATATVEVAAGKTARATLTSKGSGVVAGHVRVFGSGAPVQGMQCHTVPRNGTIAMDAAAGDSVRSDAQGAFVIAAAPGGEIAVVCDGLWRNYSDGLRMITLSPSQRVELDVPVVAWRDETVRTLGGPGLALDQRLLVPRIAQVAPGGPAATAGLKVDDVIVGVDGAPVTELSPRGVYVLIVNRAPGTKVKLDVTRGGAKISAEVTLGPSRE